MLMRAARNPMTAGLRWCAFCTLVLYTTAVAQNPPDHTKSLMSISVKPEQPLATRIDSLWLDGLTSLPAEVADALEGRGGDISLGSLTTISDAAARALGTRRSAARFVSQSHPLGPASPTGPTFGTPRLPETQGYQAAMQSFDARRILSLDGLKSLSPAAASHLARHTGILSLDGLEAISREVAYALAEHDNLLSLSGVKSLPPDVAEALARRMVDTKETRLSLSLKGVKMMLSKSAAALSQHEGSVSLDGLTTLSAAAVNALFDNKREAGFPGVRFISLRGRTEVSAEALSVLHAQPFVTLPEKFRQQP